MNRRLATSRSSDVAGTTVEGGVDGADTAVRREADDGLSTGPTRQKKKSGGKNAATGHDADTGGSGDVGQILRGAYRQAVDEAIPDDLMDLLNRLE